MQNLKIGAFLVFALCAWCLPAQTQKWAYKGDNGMDGIERKEVYHITKPDNCSMREMLSATWSESENGWSGTWTPVGEIVEVKEGTYSRTYNATWARSKPKGQENEDIPTFWYAKHFLITISGSQVTVSRKDPEKVDKYTAGAQCTYQGTIINNHVKDGSGGCGKWTAIIGCE